MRSSVDIAKRDLPGVGSTRALLKALTVAVLVAATATVIYLAR